MEPIYVEAPNGRLYEVAAVPGHPFDDDGPCLCVFDHAAQRIEVSDTVSRGELPALIAEYFSLKCGMAWTLVPVVGRAT